MILKGVGRKAGGAISTTIGGVRPSFFLHLSGGFENFSPLTPDWLQSHSISEASCWWCKPVFKILAV
jgi:hypothetical protein